MAVWNTLTNWLQLSSDPQASYPKSCDRESPRLETSFLVSFEGNSGAAETKGNVGIGGFCFEGVRVPSPGTKVDLLVDLTGSGHFVMAQGEVLGHHWTGQNLSIRGRFVKISFEDERRLARWIDSHSQGELAA